VLLERRRRGYRFEWVQEANRTSLDSNTCPCISPCRALAFPVCWHDFITEWRCGCTGAAGFSLAL